MKILTPEDYSRKFGIEPELSDKPLPGLGSADLRPAQGEPGLRMSGRESSSFYERGIVPDASDMEAAYRHRYDLQSTWDRSANAIARGTIGALGVMLEDASYMTLQPLGEITGALDEWEQNAVAQWGDSLKKLAHERFPNYQADPSQVDWSPWAILGDLIENGLGFAVPGAGLAKGVALGTKAMKASKLGAYASHLRKVAGATGSTEKALNFIAPGMISNYAEGTMMGFETYKSLKEQGYSEEEASAAADEVRNTNRALMLTDMVQLHGIYKGTKALRNTMNNPSEWKQNIKSAFTTMNADNPFFQSLVEGGEEVFQGIIQREAENKVTTGGKELRSQKDLIGRIGEYFKDESLWYEGALGFLSGGAQQMAMKEIGNAMDRSSYNKIATEMNAVTQEIDSTTDPQRKVMLEKRLEDLKNDAARTTQQGMYEAQQEMIKNTEEHLKHRFKQTVSLDILMKEALASGNASTATALQSAQFRALVFDNMARGTLDTLERQLKDMLSENLSEEEVKDRGWQKDYKQQVQKDINLLDVLENDYIEAQGYVNPSEVFFQKQNVRVKQEMLNGVMSSINDIINGTKDENNEVATHGLKATAERIASELNASEFNFNKFMSGGLKLGDIEDEAEKNKLRSALERIEASEEFKKFKEADRMRKLTNIELDVENKHLETIKSFKYQEERKNEYRQIAKAREEQKKADSQKKKIVEEQQKADTQTPEQQREEVGKDVNTPPTVGTATPMGPETPKPASPSPAPPEIKVESAKSPSPPAPKTNTLEEAKKEIEEKIKAKKKEALKNLKKVTLGQLDGKSVKYKGGIYKVDLSNGKITLVGDKIDYELDSSFLNEDISSLGIKEIKDSKKTHTIDSISESEVSVNGVEYIINLDSKGNIISLSPKSNLKQNIKNEAILVAVEIARNKLDNNTIKNSENLDEVYSDTLENNAELRKVDLILGENYTESIEEALGKLYAEEKLTPEEQLILSIWLQDAIIVMTKERVKYPKSDIFQNALDNLYLIDLILYGGKNDKQQKPKSSGSSESSKETIRSSKEETQKEGEQVTKVTKGPESKKEELVDLKKEIYKQEQRELKILEDLLNAKSAQDLLALYNSLTPEEKSLFKDFFIERKNELTSQSENKPEQTPEAPQPAAEEVTSPKPDKVEELIPEEVLEGTKVEGDLSPSEADVRKSRELQAQYEKEQREKQKAVESTDSYKITTHQREFVWNPDGEREDISDDYRRGENGEYLEDIINILDPQVREGTELIFQIDPTAIIYYKREKIPYEQYERENGLNTDLIPIRILTKDGKFLGWVPSGSKKKIQESQLRSSLYSKFLDGVPITAEITYKYDGQLFMLMDGAVMNGEEAFPNVDTLAVVGNLGKVTFSDGKEVPIDDRFKNPGFTHIILPDGRFVVGHPDRIGESHANIMVDAIEIFVRSIHNDNRGKPIQEVLPEELIASYNALKAAGYDVTNKPILESFLAMYLFTVTPDKRNNEISPEERALGINSPLSKFVALSPLAAKDKPMVQIQSNGVAFLMNNQKTPHGTIGYSIGANSPLQTIDDAEWKDQLRQVILNSYRNTDRDQLNKQVVDLQKDNEGKITSKKTTYNKLAKSGISVRAKQTNLGTEDNPQWVHTVNPVVRFKLTDSKPVEEVPTIVEQEPPVSEKGTADTSVEGGVSSTPILDQVRNGSLDASKALKMLEEAGLQNAPEYREVYTIAVNEETGGEIDEIILAQLPIGDIKIVQKIQNELLGILKAKGYVNSSKKILDYAGFLNEVNKFSDKLNQIVINALPLPASFNLGRIMYEQNGMYMFNMNALGFYDLSQVGLTQTNGNMMGQAFSDAIERYELYGDVEEFIKLSKIHKVNCK